MCALVTGVQTCALPISAIGQSPRKPPGSRADRDAAHEAKPASASEDFSEFGRAWQVPYVFWFVGGTDPASYAKARSEEHTSELQSLMRISYAVFCLKKKTKVTINKKPPPSLTQSTFKPELKST